MSCRTNAIRSLADRLSSTTSSASETSSACAARSSGPGSAPPRSARAATGRRRPRAAPAPSAARPAPAATPSSSASPAGRGSRRRRRAAAAATRPARRPRPRPGCRGSRRRAAPAAAAVGLEALGERLGGHDASQRVEGDGPAPRARVGQPAGAQRARHGQPHRHRARPGRLAPAAGELAHVDDLRAGELRDRPRRLGLGRVRQRPADLAWIDRLQRHARRRQHAELRRWPRTCAPRACGTASRARSSTGRRSGRSPPPGRAWPCSSARRRGRCRRSTRPRGAARPPRARRASSRRVPSTSTLRPPWEASTTTSTPASARASPLPSFRSTRYSGACRESTRTSCPRAVSSRAASAPTVPVPPTIAMFMCRGRDSAARCDKYGQPHFHAARASVTLPAS